jgi:hypothetical protein
LSRANVVVNMAAAPTPCTTRAVISSAGSVASPQASDESAKTISPPT